VTEEKGTERSDLVTDARKRERTRTEGGNSMKKEVRERRG